MHSGCPSGSLRHSGVLVVLQFEQIVGTSPSPIALLLSELAPRAADELLVDSPPAFLLPPSSAGVEVPDARLDVDTLLAKPLDRADWADVPRALPVEDRLACPGAGTGGARMLVEGPLEPDDADDESGPSFILWRLGDDVDLNGPLGRFLPPSGCRCDPASGVGAFDVLVDLAGPRMAVGLPCVG